MTRYEPSPEQNAKMNRARLASAHRAAVMEAEEKKAIGVRANMARLKELRLAKEAEHIRQQVATVTMPKAVPKKKIR
ncbi:MAG TPA: transcriptional regulator [Bradyrhizobium sp.]|jgi:hypothetical protein|nr:transcriptional regulator [Bradyrhizobium sp.]